MALTNTSKPSTTFANQSKVSIGETWATITTMWASETRTWLEASQLITNTAFDRSGGNLWSVSVYLWLLPSPWTYSGGSGMTNTPKP